ncbi:protein trichome birefringence-like 13 isoform X1 [Selaginella moellendorffii]|uniref:protein trichome birefringence-like 13 isoform X1 n=1 Tax=Selaginella moellendorffii TaxID=88036 RepID=UPI000D1D0021|nr:protein trichome birefringence-like 13 isoform X1 [Selaginella moellendorffii]|eukprot:XP_024517733.1 protein trichome birefringence-like 13 isoform X1 [Selaginella moellendorffii]
MASLWRKHQQRLRQAASLHRYSTKNPSFSCAAFAIVVLAAAASLWLYLHTTAGARISQFQARDAGDPTHSNVDLGVESGNAVARRGDQGCDYSRGRWVYDPQRQALYNESCVDIFKGWNCVRNQRSNAGSVLRWRWQPDRCDLARLDPAKLLENLQGKNIGFVGDSLNRNMYASLVCTLKQAASKDLKKWRPIGSDKGITFLGYNVTVAYHRTNLLARYGEWKASADGGPLEEHGYKQGYRVDVDIPQSTWSEAPQFYDILVISTGHWWFAPEKFNPVTSPMLFFENGKPIVPPKSPREGLDLTLKYMLSFAEQNMKPGGIKFLRTQSPRHFDGGDWYQGGKCHRSGPLKLAEVGCDIVFVSNPFVPNFQVEEMFSPANKGVNKEVRLVNEHLFRAASASSTFRLLNITHLSEFRADGHPSTSAKKQHEDCMHWCLPGVTDTWNEILGALILEESVTGVL